jgi:hypothetical protein
MEKRRILTVRAVSAREIKVFSMWLIIQSWTNCPDIDHSNEAEQTEVDISMPALNLLNSIKSIRPDRKAHIKTLSTLPKCVA